LTSTVETNAPARRTRTFVSEIMLTQLSFAIVVGLIALGCLWFVASWVVRDNLEDWSARWVHELESLGSGLYLEQDDPSYLALGNYLERYEEVLYVRYYNAEGKPFYVESSADTIPFEPLDTAAIERLASRAELNNAHIVDESLAPLVRLSRAIVTESIASTTDLFSAESLDELTTERSTVGFVELGIDYSRYDRQLVGSVFLGSVFVTLAFFILAGLGWLIIARAVQPLRQLEEPLKKLAAGELDIQVPDSPHREIAAIGEALTQAARAIKERDQHLRHLASYDQLTGLANRRHFLEEVEHRLADGGALLFVDLDQFKYVNDTVGHRGGDAVLAQTADRLRQTVRPDDLIARFGGDEFVMFIGGVTTARAEQLANKLLNDLKEYPLTHAGQSFNVGCSVGVAMVEANTGFTPTELVSQADVACRQAKAEGRNRAHLYLRQEGEFENIQSDLDWQRRIKRAIKDDRLELHYQPLMHTASGQINHYEALVRLRDEGGKLHYPNTFLPAAQRFGMLKELDQWVIRRAIRELAEHRKRRPNLRFSVNITGNTFIDGAFADFVIEELERSKLPASAIIFEITEQVAIGTFSDTVPQIRALIKRGAEFAVDDFGTGYSSLSYLKRLPVAYIKIDGVFIQRLTESTVDQTIVRAISDIARIMGKRTVAEFVGDEATMALIKDIGIDYAQGFHIGKPARELLEESPENVVEFRAS
jgi:diguanylate cyclase (GGDEF)-like protein